MTRDQLLMLAQQGYPLTDDEAALCAPSLFQTGPAPGRAPVLPEDWHGPVNTLGPEPAP